LNFLIPFFVNLSLIFFLSLPLSKSGRVFYIIIQVRCKTTYNMLK